MNKKPSLIIKSFFNAGDRRQYQDGEVILRGDEPAGVFYIEKGFVKVYSISDNGDSYIHIIYKGGELFPLIGALLGIRRNVFYESLEKSVLWEVPKEEFVDFLQTDSPVCYEILCQLAEQFNVYADRLDNLEYKSAGQRVVYRVLFLASRFGRQDGNKIMIEAPLTHKIIADSINLTRETVSRELEKLEEEKLISLQGRKIIIFDVDGLNKLISQPISRDLWGLNHKD